MGGVVEGLQNLLNFQAWGLVLLEERWRNELLNSHDSRNKETERVLFYGQSISTAPSLSIHILHSPRRDVKVILVFIRGTFFM